MLPVTFTDRPMPLTPQALERLRDLLKTSA
jgi:hypothetical protein